MVGAEDGRHHGGGGERVGVHAAQVQVELRVGVARRQELRQLERERRLAHAAHAAQAGYGHPTAFHGLEQRFQFFLASGEVGGRGRKLVEAGVGHQRRGRLLAAPYRKRMARRLPAQAVALIQDFGALGFDGVGIAVECGAGQVLLQPLAVNVRRVAPWMVAAQRRL